MWGEMAKEAFEVGTTARLTSVYVDVHRGQTRVSSGDSTVYEVQPICYLIYDISKYTLPYWLLVTNAGRKQNHHKSPESSWNLVEAKKCYWPGIFLFGDNQIASIKPIEEAPPTISPSVRIR